MKHVEMPVVVSLAMVQVLVGCSPAKETSVTVKHAQYQTVEAACGECQFEMEGSGCDLAVRIDGVAYFVDGTEIDDHGDAHAEDGFCNAIGHARVKGELIDGRFHATEFELVPDEPAESK